MVENCVRRVNKSAHMKQNSVAYKMYVFTLLHMGLFCPLSSVCLQNLKIYVSL